MCGTIRPLPHASSWRSAKLLKHRDNFTFNYQSRNNTRIGLFFDLLPRLGGRDPCHVVSGPRGFENGQHVLLDVSNALKLVIKHSVSRLCNCMKCQARAWISSRRIRPGGSVVTRPFSSIPNGANAKLCRRYDSVNYHTKCTSRLLTIPISHVFWLMEASDVDILCIHSKSRLHFQRPCSLFVI
jgi:hypothetical protein